MLWSEDEVAQVRVSVVQGRTDMIKGTVPPWPGPGWVRRGRSGRSVSTLGRKLRASGRNQHQEADARRSQSCRMPRAGSTVLALVCFAEQLDLWFSSSARRTHAQKT